MASSIPASVPADPALAAAPAVPRTRRRTRMLALAGGVFVLLLAAVAIAAPWLAPREPWGTASPCRRPRSVARIAGRESGWYVPST